MVNYPNAKRAITTVQKVSASQRGMNLEQELNLSNQYYCSNGKAVIHKKPTPINIVKVDYPARKAAKIIEAYYRSPSTTDYNGIYRGKYIDFEAKETRKLTFPSINISNHQIDHLESIIEHRGIAFVIIAFSTINEVYLVDASFIIEAFKKSLRKSVKYEEIKEHGHQIKQGYNPRLDYLSVVDDVYF